MTDIIIPEQNTALTQAYREKGCYLDETLSSWLKGNATNLSANPAIISSNGNKTYTDLSSEVSRLAAGLQALGLKKGDIIARMYIPPTKSIAEKTHIHFNLIREGGGGFISPSIFTQAIVREFHRRWNLFPNDPDSPIPPCMGYKLQADENPFERKAVITL